MGLTIFGVTRTGHNFQSLEKLYEMKDYSIVGSSLMGTEIGIELHVDVKVGQHNGSPVVVSYHIFQDAYGAYSYGIDEEDFSNVGTIANSYSYNCHAIDDASALGNNNSRFVYKSIGRNGYQCIGIPIVKDYDKDKVKELAFWCLDNHYIPELKEVFSLVKPVEEMKTSKDEVVYNPSKEATEMLEANGAKTKILDASANFASFVNQEIYQKHKHNEKTTRKDVYFGYVYEGGIQNGQHYPMVVLEGSEAVAKFVCDPNHIGNDKMVTDTLDRMIFSTYGVYIDKRGKYADPSVVEELIDKVIKEQFKIFGNEEENNIEEKGEERE